jgi:hypothetical protein
LHEDILSILPPKYEFIDYVYKISNSALSTFHRDVTSSKNIYSTKHPVYTLILYKYDGELISLCPGSNYTYPLVFSHIVNISGYKGSAFLFDCDLLHAGCPNECNPRVVVQYKICHNDDIPHLKHLQKVFKEKNGKCENTLYKKCLRKLSYYFEFPINYIFYPLLQKRYYSQSIMGKIQQLIPISYYNND